MNLRKKLFLAAHAAAATDFFGPVAADDRNWPARRRRHNDVGAQLYLGDDRSLGETGGMYIKRSSSSSTSPSKFYISLKSFFFGRDWAGSTSE